ncbi:hypothetical protein [Streptomyces sp. NPDC102264]|uniref:hypothetical protein n=1 Tax=Streptomyces sp. NPDC102264 TaxID=3366149 RepID=UPI003806CF0C
MTGRTAVPSRSGPATADEGARTHISAPCWIAEPADVLHCTEPPGHDGDHYHAYTRTQWPRREGETQ